MLAGRRPRSYAAAARPPVGGVDQHSIRKLLDPLGQALDLAFEVRRIVGLTLGPTEAQLQHFPSNVPID